MKAANCILKIVAGALAVAAVICCVIAYWDKIVESIDCIKGKLCKGGCCDSEYDDYVVDWDAE